MLEDIIKQEIKAFLVTYKNCGELNEEVVIAREYEIKNILSKRNYFEIGDIVIIKLKELNLEEISVKDLTAGDFMRLFKIITE